MTAVYQPRNKVAALIMPHFSDRFHEDNFAIWDKTHDVAGVHPEGGGAREWFLVEHFQQDHPDMVLKMFTEDAEEKDLEHMWKTFCETTDIAERKNTNLQRNLIPLYFRGNMTEFTE